MAATHRCSLAEHHSVCPLRDCPWGAHQQDREQKPLGLWICRCDNWRHPSSWVKQGASRFVYQQSARPAFCQSWWGSSGLIVKRGGLKVSEYDYCPREIPAIHRGAWQQSYNAMLPANFEKTTEIFKAACYGPTGSMAIISICDSFKGLPFGTRTCVMPLCKQWNALDLFVSSCTDWSIINYENCRCWLQCKDDLRSSGLTLEAEKKQMRYRAGRKLRRFCYHYSTHGYDIQAHSATAVLSKPL